MRYFDNSIFGSEWAPHAGLVTGYKDRGTFLRGQGRELSRPGGAGQGRNGSELKPEIMHHM